MIPVSFPQANSKFGSPKELQGSCWEIEGFCREVVGGIWDGTPQVIVAWKPSMEEIRKMLQGNPIFLSVMGGLPPHRLAVDFDELL